VTKSFCKTKHFSPQSKTFHPSLKAPTVIQTTRPSKPHFDSNWVWSLCRWCACV